jgi:hypothetical protein
MRILLHCLSLFIFFSARAGDPQAQLIFPPEKSQIQILPQRFEYQLLNKDQIRIGNALIDSTKIDFQMTAVGKSKDRFKLRFRWPAGLLDQGEIALKDNSGKSFWLQDFTTEQIVTAEETQQSTFEIEADLPELIRMIQLYPFFRFCLHREEPLTKIYLCSKDLYFKRNQSDIQIVIKDSHRSESFVEINGQNVGDQGVIYLNSPSEFVSLRALLASGTNLEIDTRMKKINFKDVVLTEDQSQIKIQAEGSEPVDASTVEKISPTQWQTFLDVSRPSVYVKGEGNLPLRQEFLIKGPVRRENIQVNIMAGHTQSTLKNQHTLKIKPAEGLKLAQADKNTRLTKISSQEYLWTLTGLQKKEVNRRYVKVIADDGEYFAAYDLQRLAAFDASLRLMAPLWAQAKLTLNYSEIWSGALQYDSQFTQTLSTEPTIKALTLNAQRRLEPGVAFRDPGVSVELYLQYFSLDPSSLAALGAGVAGELASPPLWHRFFPWSQLRLRLPLLSFGGTTSIKSSYETELALRSADSASGYWEVGLRNHHYVFSGEGLDTQSDRTMIFLGLGQIF